MERHMEAMVKAVVSAICIQLLVGCGGGGGSGSGPDRGAETEGFTVTAIAETGGTITPSSSLISSGETATFTIGADAGFQLESVTGCGGSLVGSVYTTAAIDADCTVTASFIEAIPSTLADIIPLNNSSFEVFGVQVQLDSNGDGWVAWLQKGPSEFFLPTDGVYVSRLQSGLWQKPVGFRCGGNALTASPLIQADSKGNAALAFQCAQSDVPPRQILMDRYVNGLGWIGSEIISTVVDISFSQGSIDFNETGNGLYVYAEQGFTGGEASDLWFHRFDAASGWSSEQRLLSNTDAFDADPRVSLDSSGNGLSVWRRYSAANRESGELIYSEYISGLGWQDEKVLPTADSDVFSYFEFAANSRGDAVVAYSGTLGPVYVNRYVVGEGWQGEEELLNAQMRNFSLHVEEDGDTVIIGERAVTDSGLLVWTFDGIEGWTSQVVAASTNVSPRRLDTATDGNGAYIAAWEAGGVWYLASRADQAEWSVEARPAGQVSLKTAMSSNGTGIVVWEQILATDFYLLRSETVSP